MYNRIFYVLPVVRTVHKIKKVRNLLYSHMDAVVVAELERGFTNQCFPVRT
jgi:hypothetical protein